MSRLITYFSCGLTIQSDIELPELFVVNAVSEPQITVKSAEVHTDAVSNATVVKPYSRYTRDEYFFELPDVIRLLVRNGTDVQVQFLTADIEFATEFIYSNALPVAMLQRKMILFRASGVLDHTGQAWLFFSPPRFGKTTLALLLKERGYRFFTDQRVLLSPGDANVYAIGFGPAIHIWQPVAEIQESFSNDELKPIRSGIPKFNARFKEDFVSNPVVVKGIVNLDNMSTIIRHHNLTPVDAFEILRNAVMFNQMTGDMGIEPMIMQMLSTLIRQTKIIQLSRPKFGYSYHELAKYADEMILSGGVNG